MKLKLKYFGNINAILGILSMVILAQTASAETWFTNEVWISPIAQTNGGNGTLDYPYDGSTQAKFDTVMVNLPANTTIHLLAGTYQTHGSSAYSPKSGQKILGSGIDITIVQLASDTSGDVTVFGTYASTNIEVADLTADCNYTTGSCRFNGVILTGTKHAIRRVKVINGASWIPGTEFFGIVIQNCCNGPSNSDGNIIEECEVSQFKGGTGCSGICLNSDGANHTISGIVRNNHVYLPITNGAAINGAWLHDAVVEGNYVDGTVAGFYGDTGGYTNVIVAHNTFKNCLYPVALANSARRNLTFCFNTMVVSAGGQAFAFNSNGSYTNIAIIGNNIISDTQPGAGRIFLAAANITGLVVANNTVDSGFTNTFAGCANISTYNNYDLYGNYLTNLNQVASPNGMTRRTANFTAVGLFNTNYVSYADKYIGVQGIPGSGSPKIEIVVLPPAVGHAGKDFIVADETGNLRPPPNTKIIEIRTISPDQINGTSIITNMTPYTAISVISDGTNWFAH